MKLHSWLSKIRPVNVQAALNLRWAHMSKGTFSDVAAHMLWVYDISIQNLQHTFFFVETKKNYMTISLLCYYNEFIPSVP